MARFICYLNSWKLPEQDRRQDVTFHNLEGLSLTIFIVPPVITTIVPKFRIREGVVADPQAAKVSNKRVASRCLMMSSKEKITHRCVDAIPRMNGFRPRSRLT
jgi:hypothetical protein